MKMTDEPTSGVFDVGFIANNRQPTTTQDQRASRRDCKVYTKQSYRQPLLVNSMNDSEQRMKKSWMHHSLPPWKKAQIIF
jgi:hypothetical protein